MGSDLSPVFVQEILGRGSAAEGAVLAQPLVDAFGHEALAKGVCKAEQTTVLWAIEVETEHAPALVARTLLEDGAAWAFWRPAEEPKPDPLAARTERCTMQRVSGAIYATVRYMPNFTATAYRLEWDHGCSATAWLTVEDVRLEPDCLPQSGIPHGTVTEQTWRSAIFPGTVRSYWLYVPAQYRPGGPPLCLMVFQDGGSYLTSRVPVPTVFDNLIDKGDMPLTAGLFINPGTFPQQEGRAQNRSFEYDTLSDQYVRFLRDEMIPQVEKVVNLRQDADSHAICGISSGGICSFTAAWQMPELFSKVLSAAGTSTHHWCATLRASPYACTCRAEQTTWNATGGAGR